MTWVELNLGSLLMALHGRAVRSSPVGSSAQLLHATHGPTLSVCRRLWFHVRRMAIGGFHAVTAASVLYTNSMVDISGCYGRLVEDSRTAIALPMFGVFIKMLIPTNRLCCRLCRAPKSASRLVRWPESNTSDN